MKANVDHEDKKGDGEQEHGEVLADCPDEITASPYIDQEKEKEKEKEQREESPPKIVSADNKTTKSKLAKKTKPQQTKQLLEISMKKVAAAEEDLKDLVIMTTFLTFLCLQQCVPFFRFVVGYVSVG